jgi:hypothetical protein
VHPIETRDAALALIAQGLNDCEVARRLLLPRTTVRDWRNPRNVRSPRPTCPRCWRPSAKPVVFTDADYAELLGLYLGDGHIVRTARTYRLRLFLDTKYGQVISDAEALLRRCFPYHGVGRFRTGKGTTTILSVYYSHIPCLFPQHGAGVKHDRRIELETWQEEIAAAQPWPLMRGLIRSDGCVFVNRTGPYEYVCYQFANLSWQIRNLFMDACDRVEVQYRAYSRDVRIYRRESVALMQKHVGAKA